MSATPWPKVYILERDPDHRLYLNDGTQRGFCKPTHPDPARREIHAKMIERAVNVFEALLAVAREADVHLHGKPGPRNPGNCCSKVCQLIDELDAAHPGWREWS